MAKGLPALPPVSGSHPHAHVAGSSNIEGMSVEELLALRLRIDEQLPAKSLAGLDLEKELVLQMLATQNLQKSVLTDYDVPANQKAQVCGAVASVLGQLVKLQSDIYTTERMKKLEEFMRGYLNDIPRDDRIKYLDKLDSALGRL